MKNERHSRQSFLGDSSQETIESAIVGVVGLGGGGSHIVQQLAHIGFKNFELFDADTVDPEGSNLNRLIGAKTTDAKRQSRKMDIAKKMILGLQPDAKIGEHFCTWQEAASALKRCHIVFGCVDSFLGRDQLEQFTRRYLIAYVDIGMEVVMGSDKQPVMGGQVIASLPGQACMRCMGLLTEELLLREAERYGAAGSRPQVVWPNGVLASSAVGIGVDLLTDWTKRISGPVFLEYDGNRGTVKNRSQQIRSIGCNHYLESHVGEPVFLPLGSQEA